MLLRSLVVVFICLCGCSPLVPLPEQRPIVSAEDPPDERFYVRMAAPSAGRRIVRDIAGNPASFRWTSDTPAVELKLPDSGPWIAQMEFGAAEATLKDTGPVTIDLRINGVSLGHITTAKPGEITFNLPVPESAVPESGEVVLEALVKPVWVAPGDGARLGVLLKAMGFLRP